MFSSSILGALTSAQAGDLGQQMDSDVANNMIGQLDSNGDGSLSLSEIESALGQTSGTDANSASSSTAGQDGLSAAFAQVDTNGDGQLSADELTSALGQMKTQHAHGHGHHHHGGGAPPDATASDSTTGIDGTSSDDPSIATTAATSSSSSSSSSSSTPGLTAADIAQAVQAFATQLQQQVANMEAQLQSSSGATSVTA